MEFSELLEIIQDEPVFDTDLLLAGDVDERDIHRQLSRWKKAGKIYQLKQNRSKSQNNKTSDRPLFYFPEFIFLHLKPTFFNF